MARVLGVVARLVRMTLDDPIEDGWLKKRTTSRATCPTGPLLRANETGAIIFGGYGYSGDHRAYRGYVEWDISFLFGVELTKNPVFKYHGRADSAHYEEINPISNQPSTASDATLWTDIASGVAYVNPFNFQMAPKREVDLGAHARVDLQSAIDAERSWFALGFQSPGDECPGVITGVYWAFFSSKEYGAADPPPTLYVEGVFPSPPPAAAWPWVLAPLATGVLMTFSARDSEVGGQ